MADPGAGTRLTELLIRFPTDPDLVTEFDTAARPVLTKMARRAGRFLAADQRGDVVQQAMLLLLSGAGGTFDPARGPAEGFLWQIIRRATREVAAMYTEPGRRTRPPRSRPIEPVEARRRKPLVLAAQAGQLDPLEAAEQRCDVSLILKTAPRPVAHALRRIHLEDAPVGTVATELGMSRFSVMRAVARFTTAYAA